MKTKATECCAVCAGFRVVKGRPLTQGGGYPQSYCLLPACSCHQPKVSLLPTGGNGGRSNRSVAVEWGSPGLNGVGSPHHTPQEWAEIEGGTKAVGWEQELEQYLFRQKNGRVRVAPDRLIDFIRKNFVPRAEIEKVAGELLKHQYAGAYAEAYDAALEAMRQKLL